MTHPSALKPIRKNPCAKRGFALTPEIGATNLELLGSGQYGVISLLGSNCEKARFARAFLLLWYHEGPSGLARLSTRAAPNYHA